MGVSYELAEGIVRIETLGDLEYERGLRTMRDALDRASKARKVSSLPPWHLLFDVRGYQGKSGSDELRGIAALIVLYRRDVSGRCAVVAPSGPGAETARAFGEFLQGVGQEVEVFSEPGEAERWLKEPGPSGSGACGSDLERV